MLDTRIELRRDAIISPLLPGSHKKRLIIKCSPVDLPIRHQRDLGEEGPPDAVERVSFEADDDLTAVEVIDGPVIYAGPLWLHFGHFSSECIHRLWPRKAFNELGSAKIAFHWTRKPTPRQLPPWAVEILRLMDINVDDVIYIDRPMKFSEIYFPRQGRVLGGKTLIEDYQQLFPFRPDLVRSSRPSTCPNLYVSRSRHRHTGSYFGEEYIERILASAGFEIVFPESESVTEMAALLRAARNVVFAEGSAIHNLEFCGRLDADIFVIARRNGSRTRFGALVDSTSRRSNFFEDVTSLTPLEWDITANRPAIQRSPTVLDLSALVSAISAFTGISLPEPDENTAKDAIRMDLRRYVLEQNPTPLPTSDDQLGLLLRELRKQVKSLGL